MALEAGTKLGLYESLSPLGAGGMGEVYTAKTDRSNFIGLDYLAEFPHPWSRNCC